MSNQLQDTINMIVPFCRYQEANIGTSNQPIIGIANTVRNIILSAPFTWKFNRATQNITTVANQQDYSQAITTFGFLEKATASDGVSNWELKDVKNNEAMGVSSGPNATGRPMSVTMQSDVSAGVYLVRLSPVPDKIYTINLIYQNGPVQFANLTDLWSPIPDSFSDIYNNMSLGYYMDSCQDPRGQQYISRGLAGLLARSAGLSQLDRAVFMQAYLNLNQQEIINQLRAQQAQQAQAAR